MQMSERQLIDIEELLEAGSFPFGDKLLQMIKSRKSRQQEEGGIAPPVGLGDTSAIQQQLAQGNSPLINKMLSRDNQQMIPQ
jgi:hypothetical protein